MSTEILYNFSFDCGRMGTLDGVFFAQSEHVERTLGRTLRFGEVLGKHSDITGPLDRADIEAAQVPAADLAVLLKYRQLIESGFNPLAYDMCVDCEDGGLLDADFRCSYCRDKEPEVTP